MVKKSPPPQFTPDAKMHIWHERETAASAGIQQQVSRRATDNLTVTSHKCQIARSTTKWRLGVHVEADSWDVRLRKFRLHSRYGIKRVEDTIYWVDSKRTHEVGRKVLAMPHETEVPA